MAPALFFVHGGYWKATTSKEWSYVAKGLTDKGFVVVVENYALRPAVTVAEIVRQHRAAFAHFWAHAGEHGVDASRIVVAGHSAGGHAVAMLMQTPWESEYGLPAHPIKAAIPISGLFDLRPLAPTVFGPMLALSESEETALSPQLHVQASDVPHVVVYGTQETDEFERQSSHYAQALDAAGIPCDVLPLPHDHFTILDALADGDGVIARLLIAMAMA
nr:alpha/beta hydrolase [Robbsia betulipollinis]